MTNSPVLTPVKETNNLFPVFLKLENLHLLVVGGGEVGLEKLNAVLSNSPATKITLVADLIGEQIKALAEKHNTIKLVERSYQRDDLNGIDLVIVAVDDKASSAAIQKDAKENGILINVADTP